MKRILCILLMLALFACTLVSCVDNEPEISANANGIVYPSLNRGTKIESLPSARQQLIDEYVSDCQNIYTAYYVPMLATWDYARLGDPYLSFTDTLVYDFSKVNESNMDNATAKMWNEIKALNGGESDPIMYIELSGFLNYFGDTYLATSLLESSIYYGYFIYENETVVPMLYRHICMNYYVYKMPDGTELINCGNKYSGEKRNDELVDLYQSIQNGLVPEDVLKRLTLVK